MRLSSLNDWGSSRAPERAAGSARASDQSVPHNSIARYTTYLLAAITLSIVAYFAWNQARPAGMSGSLASTLSAATRPAADSYVLLARTRIQKGVELKPSMFNLGHAPGDWVPENAIRDVAEISGLYASVNIPADFPLVRDYVIEKNRGSIVSRKIPDGYRAVSIATSTTSSVEGWARAGTRVDVQWIGELNRQTYSKIMVENAEVLSIERQTNAAQLSKNTAPSTVTLMATIEDANKLGLVAGIGDLVLHLRGAQDDQAGPPRGILKSEDLFAKREPSIDERVQGVARVKAGQGDSKTWALVDGKWGEHKPPLEAKSTTTSDRQAAR